MFADIMARVGRTEKVTRGQRLRQAMGMRGYGVNELNRIARRRDGSGISNGYVSRFLNDERDNPGIEEMAALADALNVSLAWLAWGEGSIAETDMPTKAKPVLEAVLVALNSKGRWGAPTIAAARAMARDCQPEDWPSMLDRIEKELAPIIAKLEKGGGK